ncbi:hypothetical protein ACKVMY_21735 [Vibrio natriegens]|uniref:hypothetical protein n=1 Tax=Vibrio natriegens TaxID=691 RepID=UPI001D15F983|nr:hypothetical protein [Vibrio parahaemolyticus]MDF5524635.1 hypothetical protein [Vibrio parahaemolyticus]MDF5535354.1 hypothetical protein [Vibrio parahaemolyticus]MDF5551840.1 hypothetical protein [Vibrio parahaemolyticus]MDF5562316.1 hypothetical protein [Vibrio parahaemolyticus]
MFWKKINPLLKLSIWNRDTSMTPLVRVKEDLKIYVAETEESTERMLETIYAIMENNGLTYQQAINTEEGREALYQLMLHRHWVAFHAEVIRTVVASEEDVFKAGYKKLSLNQTATIETNILLDQFIRETSAYFEEQMSDPRW